MKYYIRTKDTIFEVVGQNALVYKVKAKGNPNNLYSKSKNQTNVIKSSSHLEDLCDEFICKTKGDGYLIIDKYGWEQVKHHKEMANQTNNELTIYGAIWTSKGLIYVSKMNDKGELELLCH